MAHAASMAGQDLATVLGEHHRLLSASLSCVEADPVRPGEDLVENVRKVVSMVVRTFVLQEMHFHPLLNSTPAGDVIVEAALDDHDVAEGEMERLLLLDPADPEYVPRLRSLIRYVDVYLTDARAWLHHARGVPADAQVLDLWQELHREVYRHRRIRRGEVSFSATG